MGITYKKWVFRKLYYVVKHHGCSDTIILSLDGGYHQMAKQLQKKL
jgi:hypothetical protein